MEENFDQFGKVKTGQKKGEMGPVGSPQQNHPLRVLSPHMSLCTEELNAVRKQNAFSALLFTEGRVVGYVERNSNLKDLKDLRTASKHKPYTPHPTPHTPNPQPPTPNPQSPTPNPKTRTPNLKPQTPNPKPLTSSPTPRPSPDQAGIYRRTRAG